MVIIFRDLLQYLCFKSKVIEVITLDGFSLSSVYFNDVKTNTERLYTIIPSLLKASILFTMAPCYFFYGNLYVAVVFQWKLYNYWKLKASIIIMIILKVLEGCYRLRRSAKSSFMSMWIILKVACLRRSAKSNFNNCTYSFW